jgi:peptide/nickel transport system permease protein
MVAGSSAGSAAGRGGAGPATRRPRPGVPGRLLADPNGRLGLALLLLLCAATLLAPWIAPYSSTAINPAQGSAGPSVAHPFGQDQVGRDIMTRVMYGGRLSLLVGFIAVSLALAVGVPVGLIAGYAGGAVDLLLMRVIDLMMAFPSILLAILVVAVLGSGLENVMLAVGIAGVPLYARLMRASVLSVKEVEYVQAARALGQTTPSILLRHVAPNCLAPLIVQATLRVGTAILTAASLSFLGLGVQPPTPEWGAMVSEGRTYITTAPHITIFPGLAIVVAVLGFNILGDALNDALNPRLQH